MLINFLKTVSCRIQEMQRIKARKGCSIKDVQRLKALLADQISKGNHYLKHD